MPTIAPFHFWAPEAYDGAPVCVAAFVSVVPRAGVIFALAQVVRDPTVGGAVGWPLVVAALAKAELLEHQQRGDDMKEKSSRRYRRTSTVQS